MQAFVSFVRALVLSWPPSNVRGDRLRDYFDSIHSSGTRTTGATRIPLC